MVLLDFGWIVRRIDLTVAECGFIGVVVKVIDNLYSFEFMYDTA